MSNTPLPFNGQITFFPGILHKEYEVRDIEYAPITKDTPHLFNDNPQPGDPWAVYAVNPVGFKSALAYCSSRDIAEAFSILLEKLCAMPVITEALDFKFDFNYKEYIDKITTPNAKNPFQSSITFHTYLFSPAKFDNTEVDSMKLNIKPGEIAGSDFGISSPVDMDLADECQDDETPDYWAVFLHIVPGKDSGGRECVADCDTQFTAYTLNWILQAINRLYIRQ